MMHSGALVMPTHHRGFWWQRPTRLMLTSRKRHVVSDLHLMRCPSFLSLAVLAWFYSGWWMLRLLYLQLVWFQFQFDNAEVEVFLKGIEEAQFCSEWRHQCHWAISWLTVVDVQDPHNGLYQKALEMTEKVFFTNSLHTTVTVVKRLYSF